MIEKVHMELYLVTNDGRYLTIMLNSMARQLLQLKTLMALVKGRFTTSNVKGGHLQLYRFRKICLRKVFHTEICTKKLHDIVVIDFMFFWWLTNFDNMQYYLLNITWWKSIIVFSKKMQIPCIHTCSLSEKIISDINNI